MAFNQASFFLFPPRYAPEVELDDSAKTMTGKPLQIISAKMVDAVANEVEVKALHHWFADRGFEEKERYGRLCVLWCNPTTTFLGRRGEMELKLPLDEEEIEELYMRFLLTENTPKQIPAWSELICELGYDFGFQIMDDDNQLLPCIDFKFVLRSNWNFRAYQQNYRWDVDAVE